MKATFDTTGEVLVVTGGAHGIGAALVAAYAQAGGTSVVLDVLAVDERESYRADLGDPAASARVEHEVVDVSDRDEVFAAVERVMARHGRIDALVAGAAIQPRVAVLETDPDVWRRAIDINLNGVVWACQAVAPHMVAARNGAIVAFASGLARTGHAEASAYSATKSAIVTFITSLAAELAEHRVRANVIYPGVIDTPQFRKANPPGPELDHWLETTGVGTAHDVVGPLLFLLSDAATLTGSTLTRDRVYRKEDS